MTNRPHPDQVAATVDDLRWLADRFPDSKLESVCERASRYLEALSSDVSVVHGLDHTRKYSAADVKTLVYAAAGIGGEEVRKAAAAIKKTEEPS